MVIRNTRSKLVYLLVTALFLSILLLTTGAFSSNQYAFATAVFDGKLIIPTTGSVTQLFLDTTFPDAHGSYYDQNDQLQKTHTEFHSGVDISSGPTDCTKSESPVYAAAAGTVIFADYDRQGFGWSVRISHGLSSNGKYIFTLYGHMGTSDIKNKPGASCLKVSQGQQVTAGQLIGYQGSSGKSTGVHLHWSVLANPSKDDWKGSIWASPDFYTCMALTQGDPSPVSSVSAGENICASVVTKIPVGVYHPAGVGVNPITNRIYVANRYVNDQGYFIGPGTVSVIDGVTDVVTTDVPVGGTPHSVAVNPVTNRVYVTDNMTNSVFVIDGGTNAIVTPISVGQNPIGIDVNPITNLIYVANRFSNTVTIIDGTTNAVLNTIPLGNLPTDVAVNPVTNRVYVTNDGVAEISVLDGSTGNTVTPIPVRGSSVRVNPSINRIYVGSGNSVVLIDGTTNSIIKTVSTGVFTDIQIGVNNNTNRVYATMFHTNSVAMIDGSTGAITQIITGQSGPFGVGANYTTDRVYVANYFGKSVTVIQD